LPGIVISNAIKGGSLIPITSFSIAGNDNKFLITRTEIFECTHGGAVFSILPGFTYLRSIVANHDGTKLYVSDKGLIKLITRCSNCGAKVTTLLPTADADGLALSNDERTLYFTSVAHNTVSRVALP
jgi:DNA-binding beta-propeller fold protein YncE